MRSLSMLREGAVLAVLAALTGVSYWSQWQKEQAPAAAPPGAAVVRAEPAERAAAPVAAPVADATAPKVDRSHQLELPDGTFVATLNGATDAAPLQQYWGSEVPWSPITGVERNDQGIDWYRHENGSYSTTQMVWRSDLKRHAAMTRVGHQGPAVTPAIGK